MTASRIIQAPASYCTLQRCDLSFRNTTRTVQVQAVQLTDMLTCSCMSLISSDKGSHRPELVVFHALLEGINNHLFIKVHRNIDPVHSREAQFLVRLKLLIACVELDRRLTGFFALTRMLPRVSKCSLTSSIMPSAL